MAGLPDSADSYVWQTWALAAEGSEAIAQADMRKDAERAANRKSRGRRGGW